jgi:hypothetical protein
MHKRFQAKIHQKNMAAIEKLINQQSLDVWCAWGTLIKKRAYLTRCLLDLFHILESARCSYFKRGALSKAGHPHHPLYLKKTAPMEVLDLKGYSSTSSSLKYRINTLF